MAIEEMFRDYKSAAYYLEATALKGQRVMALILLIALAYSSAVMQGTTLLHNRSQSILFVIKSPKESIQDEVALGLV
jgi:hypothetical protein